MGEFLQQLPAEIQVHIKSITKSSGLPETEVSWEQIAQGWLDKEKRFQEEMKKENMIEVDSLPSDSAKGAVILTFSGSLVLVGPLVEGTRKCGYNSIGIRRDVPEMVTKENSSLQSDITLKQPVTFENGPVLSTSPAYKIAICQEELTAIEEEEKLSEVTAIMETEFTEINKLMLPAKI